MKVLSTLALCVWGVMLVTASAHAALPLADLHIQAALSEQQGDGERVERLWQQVLQAATAAQSSTTTQASLEQAKLYELRARASLGVMALENNALPLARSHLQAVRAAGFSGAILATHIARHTLLPEDLTAARKALARADESDPRVWLERARLAALNEQRAEVEQLAQRGVQVAEVCARGDAHTLRALAKVAHDGPLAVRALERALLVAGSHGPLVPELHMELAWAAWAAGRHQKAWNLLQRVGAGSPGRRVREQGAALAVRMALAMPQEATTERRLRLRFAARLAPWLSQARSELRRLARGGMNGDEP